LIVAQGLGIGLEVLKKKALYSVEQYWCRNTL